MSDGSWLGGARGDGYRRRFRERRTKKKPRQLIVIAPVKVISALRGGVTEEVLELIAHPNGNNPEKTPRDFGPWKTIAENVSMCVGTIGGERKILQLGERHAEGLFLNEVDGTEFSLKPDLKKKHEREIGIGRHLPSKRHPEVANQISAVWAVKGGRL